jgi:erythromycin esterase-like protein
MKRWRLCSWLRTRTYNAETGRAIGFYGLDVYSLWESLYAVFDYLEASTRTPSRLRVKRCTALNPMGKIRRSLEPRGPP